MNEVKENKNVEIIQKEIIQQGQVLDAIINRYGYGKITLISITCLFLTMLTEGIEFSLFSVYLIPLTSYYSFSSFQIKMISSSMFLSIGFGSLISGYISQKFNRVSPIKILYIFVIVFHFFMASFNNIYNFAICRNIIGFLIGVVIPIQFNVTTEYLPIKFRSFTMSSVWIAWNVGAMINALLMMRFMPNLEKEKLYMCLIVMDIFCIFAFCFNLIYLEDSPRNLLLHNLNTEKAYHILTEMKGDTLTDIDKSMITGQLLSQGVVRMDGNLKELFNSKYKITSVLLFFLWFINSMVIYGLLLVYTLTLQSMKKNIVANTTLMSIAILPSSIFAGILSEIEILGRKKAMIIGNFIPLFTITFCVIKTEYITLWYSLSNIFISVSFTIVNSYTSEVYPTVIRDKALGIMFAGARMGGFLSQIIFLELNAINMYLPYYFSIGCNFICIFLVAFLPYETYNQPLDVVDTDSKVRLTVNKGKEMLFKEEEQEKLFTENDNVNYSTFNI